MLVRIVRDAFHKIYKTYYNFENNFNIWFNKRKKICFV